MFEFDYGTNLIARPQTQALTGRKSSIKSSDIQSVMFMRWEEHCLECSAPDCFRSCPLYVQRMDRMCARFVDGINPNPLYSGLFNYGADISFRRWGKLIASITNRSIDPRFMHKLCEDELKVVRLVSFLNKHTYKIIPSKKLNLSHRYNRLRKKQLHRKIEQLSNVDLSFDDFVIEAYNPANKDITILIEISDLKKIYSKHSVVLSPGENLKKIPWNAMNIPNTADPKSDLTVKLYPDNNETTRIIVTFLYPVIWAENASFKNRIPADKIKCVIWDLDNTVWDGIIAEKEESKIKLRPNVQDVVQELDRRGVLQSIASKNDHQAAWSLLEKFSLTKYFVCAEINWEPKSANIKNIAKNLNIDPNTFAFIDDSPFERAEVARKFPEIRIFDHHSIPLLLDRTEFQVPVTLESSRRREMYQQEEKRVKCRPSYGDDYDAFLRSCELQARVFEPSSEMEIARCVELLQRTNQLNTSGRRLEETAVQELLERDDVFVGSFHCIDRFGEYGIVGVFVVELDAPNAIVTDFVVSCRVTRKGVEAAIFNWLRQKLLDKGFDTLSLKFSPTKRNRIMLDILLEIGFLGKTSSSEFVLSLPLEKSISRSDLIEVKDDVAENWRTLQFVDN